MNNLKSVNTDHMQSSDQSNNSVMNKLKSLPGNMRGMMSGRPLIGLITVGLIGTVLVSMRARRARSGGLDASHLNDNRVGGGFIQDEVDNDSIRKTA